MASYDRRPAELAEQIKALRGTEGPVEELTTMEARLPDYASQRAQGLDAVRAMAIDTARQPKAGDFQTALEWARLGVTTTLDRLLEGIDEPSPRAWLVREKATVEDDRFFDQLAGLQLGAKRDEMVTLISNLDEMIKALDAKWMTATDEDRRIEDLERDYARKMNEALRRALDEAIPIYQRLGATVGEFVDEVAKLPDAINETLVDLLVRAGIPKEYAELVPKISEPGKDSFEQAKALGIPAGDFAKAVPFLTPDPGMWVGALVRAKLPPEIGMALTLFGEARKVVVQYLIGTAAESKHAFLQQLPNEGVIVTTLARTRQGVDEFIQKNGIDVARRLTDDVKAALDRWAADQPTDGLKADAATLATEVKNGWSALFAEMEKTFETFVREHSGRFFGPVSDEVQEKLLNLSEWRAAGDEILGLHLDDRLREWRAQALAVEPGLGDAFKQIAGKVAGLPVGVQAAFRDAINAEERRFIQEVNAIGRENTAALDSAQQALGAEQVRQMFDREQLRSALRV